MLLSIKEMEARKLPFAETWKPGEIDFTDSGATQVAPLVAEGVAELLPVHVDSSHSKLVAKPVSGDVRIQGQVQTTLETECDRCLGTAVFPIDAKFDLFYKPADTMADVDEEVALDEGEAEIGFYELPGLVLEDILREQALLQLPMQRVCGEDCKGICPVCGVNRNEMECRCEANPVDGDAGDGNSGDERWNALKDIRIQ
jgi:uncharacterized protein